MSAPEGFMGFLKDLSCGEAGWGPKKLAFSGVILHQWQLGTMAQLPLVGQLKSRVVTCYSIKYQVSFHFLSLFSAGISFT